MRPQGQHATSWNRFARPDSIRARVDGVVVDLDDPPAGPPEIAPIEAVIDRIVVRQEPAIGWPSRSIWRSNTATVWCWPPTKKKAGQTRASGTISCSARSTPAQAARSATGTRAARSASTALRGLSEMRGLGRAAPVRPGAGRARHDARARPKRDRPVEKGQRAAMKKHRQQLERFLEAAGGAGIRLWTSSNPRPSSSCSGATSGSPAC